MLLRSSSASWQRVLARMSERVVGSLIFDTRACDAIIRALHDIDTCCFPSSPGVGEFESQRSACYARSLLGHPWIHPAARADNAALWRQHLLCGSVRR